MSTRQNRFGFVSNIVDDIVPDIVEDAFEEVTNLADIASPVFAPTTIDSQQLTALTEILVAEALSNAQKLTQDGPTLIKDQVEAIVTSGFEQALDALKGGAIKELKGKVTQLAEIKNWTPSNLAAGATALTTDVMDLAYTNAKEGYDIIKKIAEEVYEGLLIRIAMLYIDSVEDTLRSLITTVTSVPAAWTKIKTGAKTGNPVVVIDGLKDLLIGHTPFGATITQLQNMDAGSLVISVDAATAVGVEVNKSFGIAISLEAVSHLAANVANENPMTGFNGPIMSFISTAGMALFSAGTGTDVLIGYDVGQPDDLDGFGIDVNVSLIAKLGGSVSVGLDPISSFPPDLTSVTVGVGGGASVEASIGASYSKVIAVYYPDGFKQGNRTTNDYLVKRSSSHHFATLPSTSYLQATSHPRQLWLRYTFDKLPEGAKTHWQTLGWGNNQSRTTTTDIPIPLTLFQTRWDSLSKDQKSAAGALGFQKSTWDNAYPNGSYIRSVNSDTQTVNDTRGFKSYVDEYWDNFTWAQLAKGEQRLWRTLGFSNSNFTERKLNPSTQSPYTGKIPAIKYRKWSDLTTRQQKAATYLGYSESTWISLAPEDGATHMSHLNFKLPDGSTLTSDSYTNTPFLSYAVKNSKFYVLRELMEKRTGTHSSRWEKIPSLTDTSTHRVGRNKLSSEQSSKIVIDDLQEFSFIKTTYGNRIWRIDYIEKGVETRTQIPRLSGPLGGTFIQFTLASGEYLDSATAQKVPESEATKIDKESFGGLRNAVGYLNLSTNKGQSGEIGRKRAGVENNVWQTPENIKILSITAHHTDTSLNALTFEHKYHNPLISHKMIGKKKGKFFSKYSIRKIELFGSGMFDRLKINDDDNGATEDRYKGYGRGGTSRGILDLAADEYIKEVYAEYGGTWHNNSGSFFGYIKITTSNNRTLNAGTKAPAGEAGITRKTFKGYFNGIAGYYDHYPRKLMFFES